MGAVSMVSARVCTPVMWGVLGKVGFAGPRLGWGVRLGVGAEVFCPGHYFSFLFPDDMEVLLILLCGLLAPTILASGKYTRDQLWHPAAVACLAGGPGSWALGLGLSESPCLVSPAPLVSRESPGRHFPRPSSSLPPPRLLQALL